MDLDAEYVQYMCKMCEIVKGVSRTITRRKNIFRNLCLQSTDERIERDPLEPGHHRPLVEDAHKQLLAICPPYLS